MDKSILKQYSASELWEELNTRGFATHPIVDLEMINDAIKRAESECKVHDAYIQEKDKIWLANEILKTDEVRELLEDLLEKGIIDGWINVDPREYESWT